jgi:hypothetical protein
MSDNFVGIYEQTVSRMPDPRDYHSNCDISPVSTINPSNLVLELFCKTVSLGRVGDQVDDTYLCEHRP